MQETKDNSDPTSKRQTALTWADELQESHRQRLSRRSSRESLAIRPVSRTASVDPSLVLPTQFRTHSFDIDESRALEFSKNVPSKRKEPSDIASLEWHRIAIDEFYRRLATSEKQGLSQEQVTHRLKEYGRNQISPPPLQWLQKTLRYLFGGFGSILLTAYPPAVANLALAIIIAIVWAVQAFFAFYQELMASITSLLPDECIVLRDGQQKNVAGPEIILGDIIYIKSGNKLAADVRFISLTADAQFDCSMLTGETLPLRGTLHSTDDNYLETACIGLAGTHCTSGSGLAVVVATGDSSVFGRLAKETSRPKPGLTNLEKEIYYFVAAIVSVMTTMVVVVVIVWATWLRKDHADWMDVPVLIVDCVSVAVAFIPEGLPIANKVLCKSLKTVETLGSVSTICSDKTGTLTKNQMKVTDCMVGQASFSAAQATELMPSFKDNVDTVPPTAALLGVAVVGAMCNAGEFDAAATHLPLEDRAIFGDATDQAVLRFAEGLIPVSETRSSWKVLHKIPFNSKNKFMVHAVQSSYSALKQIDDGSPTVQTILMIKGAPDILLPRCTKCKSEHGTSVNLTEGLRSQIEETKDVWSQQAKRVILLARRSFDSSNSAISTSLFDEEVLRQVETDLESVGLVALIDPPRDDIPEVVRVLRRAGVKVHMVTGDFRLTAQAIAAQCGIITQLDDKVDNIFTLARPCSPPMPIVGGGPDTDKFSTKYLSTRSLVLSGSEMMVLTDKQWDELCKYDEIVFARTTPEQKLRIVRELQARGETVGMTGDGVNDAPSLKRSDVGITMSSGSDIAIEAADMVLLESFSAIVEAVKYGRVVFDNLKKTICYLLPAGSFSEFWPIMTSALFGLPQILSSFLMIVICCFTDCAAATAIAYEKPEADVLLLRPRNPKRDHLVNWKLILQSYGFIGMLETRQGLNFSDLWFGFGTVPSDMTQDQFSAILNTASSVYFVNLVVMQWFNLMAVRTRRLSIVSQPPFFRHSTQNLYLLPAIAFAVVIAIFFMYIHKFQSVLGTSPVPVEYWFLPMSFGMGILLLDEGRKLMVRRKPKRLVARFAW
ncbi:calcium ATPase [Viridothelium virens]|uniref:Calcium ATPase n=1 Tax=Viridothelium virens TaxID=1048519 RepID=A0A6A6HPA3_VIRVR|nr:calcium ATPase [Viridothelium virens]